MEAEVKKKNRLQNHVWKTRRHTLSNCLQANSSSWLTSTGRRLITGLDIVLTLDSTISAPYYIGILFSCYILGEGIEDSLWPPEMKLYPARTREEQNLRMGYETCVRQRQENWKCWCLNRMYEQKAVLYRFNDRSTERMEKGQTDWYCFSCRPKPWQRFERFPLGHRDRRPWSS
jgi:hypothetical protein